MITRMWEARLASVAGPALELLPAGCEIYASYDGPARVVVLSHWQDEAAVEAYAGASWGTDSQAEAAAFGTEIVGEPHVWHFTRLTSQGTLS